MSNKTGFIQILTVKDFLSRAHLLSWFLFLIINVITLQIIGCNYFFKEKVCFVAAAVGHHFKKPPEVLKDDTFYLKGWHIGSTSCYLSGTRWLSPPGISVNAVGVSVCSLSLSLSYGCRLKDLLICNCSKTNFSDCSVFFFFVISAAFTMLQYPLWHSKRFFSQQTT